MLFCSILMLTTSSCNHSGPGERSRDRDAIDADTPDATLTLPQAGVAHEVVALPPAESSRKRIQALWEETVKTIRDDLHRSMTDQAYLERRDLVLTPWFTAYFSHREEFAEAGLESTDIVGLINHVYGFSTEPRYRAERERLRGDTTAIEARIAAIQEKVNKFP
jgi:hypothetical protein